MCTHRCDFETVWIRCKATNCCHQHLEQKLTANRCFGVSRECASGLLDICEIRGASVAISDNLERCSENESGQTDRDERIPIRNPVDCLFTLLKDFHNTVTLYTHPEMGLDLKHCSQCREKEPIQKQRRRPMGFLPTTKTKKQHGKPRAESHSTRRGGFRNSAFEFSGFASLWSGCPLWRWPL